MSALKSENQRGVRTVEEKLTKKKLRRHIFIKKIPQPNPLICMLFLLMRKNLKIKWQNSLWTVIISKTKNKKYCG